MNLEIVFRESRANRRNNIRDYFKASTVNVEIFTFLEFSSKSFFGGILTTKRNLQRLPAGESGLNIMPPLDLVAFADLPTQQHDTVVAH